MLASPTHQGNVSFHTYIHICKLVGLLGITDAQHAKLKHELNRNTGETFIDIPYMAKHLRVNTFVVRIENECSQENFMVTAPFDNQCLLIVKYLL